MTIVNGLNGTIKLAIEELQNGSALFGTATDTDNYTLTISNITAYPRYLFVIFTNANTGSSTINLNGIGAVTLKKSVSTNLASGDLAASSMHILGYDGTNYQVLTLGGGGSGSGTVNSGAQYRIPYYSTNPTGTVLDAAAAITASRALVSDSNGVPTHATTTTTELNYLSGASNSLYWFTLPGTPTRSSNTVLTITDTSNANLYDLKFNRGTVLKWTDTTVKQAMVVSATYSSNAVTITIMGDVLAGTATMNTFKYALEKAEKVTFAIAGTLTTGTNLSRKWKADKPYRVFGADGLHGTAGTTNATTYDINKGGTTFMTTKLSIASAATVGNGYTADDNTSLALDDVVTVDCDSVSTTAPVDAYIDLFIFPTYNQYL